MSCFWSCDFSGVPLPLIWNSTYMVPKCSKYMQIRCFTMISGIFYIRGMVYDGIMSYYVALMAALVKTIMISKSVDWPKDFAERNSPQLNGEFPPEDSSS